MTEVLAASPHDYVPVLFTTCIEESLAFYNDVLGFRITDNCCNFRVLHAGRFFDVISTDDPGLTNGAIILYFAELENFRSRVLNRGVAIFENTAVLYE